MKNILIAGGAGFIGSHLTEIFLKKDYNVWIIDNFITSHSDNIIRLKKYPHFHFIKTDLLSINFKSSFNDITF
ncbi:MAG TPA: GDP-mannose 4,6-dehydratase, partial [Patescibacteria group bacterium]|nr:GDP-mannose 4,6-dehydratase [Patescibacteria group bacterium]